MASVLSRLLSGEKVETKQGGGFSIGQSNSVLSQTFRKRQVPNAFSQFLTPDAVDYISNNFKSSWDYDTMDMEDLQRQTQGLMPKALEAKYSDSAEDQWLKQQNLPASKSLEKAYQGYYDYANTKNTRAEFQNAYYKALQEKGEVTDDEAATIFYDLLNDAKYAGLAGYVKLPETEKEYDTEAERRQAELKAKQKENPYSLDFNYADWYKQYLEALSGAKEELARENGVRVEQLDAYNREVKTFQQTAAQKQKKNKFNEIIWDVNLTESQKRDKLNQLGYDPIRTAEGLLEFQYAAGDVQESLTRPTEVKTDTKNVVESILSSSVSDEKKWEQLTAEGYLPEQIHALLNGAKAKSAEGIVKTGNALASVGTGIAGGIANTWETTARLASKALEDTGLYATSDEVNAVVADASLTDDQKKQQLTSMGVTPDKVHYLLSGGKAYEIDTINKNPEQSFAQNILKLSAEQQEKALYGLSETGKFLGSTAISIVSNLANWALFGPALAPAYMAMEAGGQAAYDAGQKGGTLGQQTLMGITAALAEYGGESLSFGNLDDIATKGAMENVLKNGLKNFAKEGLKIAGAQALVEFGEEAVTEVANIIMDTLIMRDASEFMEYYREYAAAHPGDPKALAILKAVEHGFIQVLLSGAAGALSGVTMGSGGMLVNNIRASQTGAGIKAQGIDAVQEIIDTGKSMAQSSAAYRMANRLEAKLQQAEGDVTRLSNNDIGRQYHANLQQQETQALAQFESDLQTLGLDAKTQKAAVRAYQSLTEAGTARKGDIQKLGAAVKQAAAVQAETQADLITTKTEIKTRLDGIYSKMQQAYETGDVRAFAQAKQEYSAAYQTAQAKNQAATIKAENKVAKARQAVTDTVETINREVQEERLAQAVQAGQEAALNQQEATNQGMEQTAATGENSGVITAGGYGIINPGGVENGREIQGNTGMGRAAERGYQYPGTGAEAAGNGSEADGGQESSGGNQGNPERIQRGLTANEESARAMAQHQEVVRNATGRETAIQIVNEVDQRTANILDFVKSVTGRDAFLYVSDDDYGDGFAVDGKSYLRLNGSAHLAFVAGHEAGHLDQNVVDAGMAMIEGMRRSELDAYAATRRNRVGDDGADVKRELISDVFGKMMMEAQTGEVTKADLGLDRETELKFYEAFLEALSADLETGVYLGDAARQAGELFRAGQAEYSRTKAVDFPASRDRNERVPLIEIAEKPTYPNGAPIFRSSSLSEMMQNADAYVVKSGLADSTVTVKDIGMDVLVDYKFGLEKVIKQKHGGINQQKNLLKILPKYKQILESSKYYGRADDGKEIGRQAEYTYLVNYIKLGNKYYSVKTTLALPYYYNIDRMHGYTLDEIDIQGIENHQPSKDPGTQDSNSFPAETAEGGAGGFYSISIFDLFHNVKIPPYVKNLTRPTWTDGKQSGGPEYSRQTFEDPDGYVDANGNRLQFTVQIPAVQERSDLAIKRNGGDRFYVDVTIDGNTQRLTGNDKAALEKQVERLKQDQRMEKLSRPVRVLRKANELYRQGMDALAYYEACQAGGEEYDLAVARALIGMRARNGVGSGGQLSEPEIKEILQNSDQWKDKSAISYGRETLTRNLEDIAPSPEEGRKLVETYAAPIRKSVADMTRWQREWAERIGNLKLNAEESAMVQLVGEGRIGSDILTQGLLYENGKPMDVQKIQHAVDTFREFYEEALTLTNQTLIANGYKPVPARQNYFPHIDELGSDWQQFVDKVVKGEDVQVPTEISGMTDVFLPGKRWFKNFQERVGDQTDYDAVRGFQQYLNGVGTVIFLTDDIQRLRQLDKAIRNKYGQPDANSELGGRARSTHLNGLTAQLLEYTNQLAGKKARIDRTLEEAFGRKVFAWLDWTKKRFGANAVGGNLSTALSNFIPITQGLATMHKKSFALGMKAAVSRQVRNDGLWEQSDFLASRFGGPEPLATAHWDVKKPLNIKGTIEAQKAGQALNWLFERIDRFTAETLVFGKYQEGLRQGLSEQEAMSRADEYAERTMAGRTIGSMPTLFNSKTLGVFTQFQLEVNNQWSNMIKDIPRGAGGDKRKIFAALLQLFIYSWLYNELNEKLLTGRRPAFDPINVVAEAVSDYQNEKLGTATANLVVNVADQLPLGQLLTGGGRIPLASAIAADDLKNAIVSAMNGEESGEYWSAFGDSLLYNFVFPAAGGQVKKVVKGVEAVTKGGRYYGDKLAYPVENNADNLIHAVLFGPSAVREGREFYNSGMNPLSKSKTELYEELTEQGVADAYGFLQGMDKTGTNAGKLVSAATYDKDKDGKPDYDDKTQRLIADVLGIKVPTGVKVADYAATQAQEYIEKQRKDEDLDPKKLQEKEDLVALWFKNLGRK